ncbi:hypothetical protein [Ornithinimicrobium kibberense]|uniref:hypothetical protein n=1 Tax=Ornithinimicrobium kibberense TaxID=282060 RepID=UPI00360BC4EF
MLTERGVVVVRLGRPGDDQPRTCQGDDSEDLDELVHECPFREWATAGPLPPVRSWHPRWGLVGRGRVSPSNLRDRGEESLPATVNRRRAGPGNRELVEVGWRHPSTEHQFSMGPPQIRCPGT